MKDRKIRVLLAKVGLDGHDRGIKSVGRFLRDAGMEVIYTGVRATADQIGGTVVQEQVDVLGLSFLAGDHQVLVPKVTAELDRRGARGGLLVLVGGIILKKDIPYLLAAGVDRVFLPGTPPNEIIEYIQRESKADA